MGRHNLITILTDCDQIPSSLDTFTTDLSSEVPVPSELWRSSFPSASLWHSSEALRPEELPPSPSPSALDWGSLPLEPWAGHGSYGRQGWRPPRVCTSTCGLPAWSQSLTAAPRDAVLGTPSGHQTTLTWNADSSKTYVVQSLWGVCEFMSEKCSEHRLRYMIVTCCSAKRRTLRPHAPTASGRPLTLLFLWPMGGTCLWVLFSAVSPGRHAGPRLPLWSLQGLSSCLPFRPYPRLHPLSFVFSSAVSLPLVTRRLTHTPYFKEECRRLRLVPTLSRCLLAFLCWGLFTSHDTKPPPISGSDLALLPQRLRNCIPGYGSFCFPEFLGDTVTSSENFSSNLWPQTGLSNCRRNITRNSNSIITQARRKVHRRNSTPW